MFYRLGRAMLRPIFDQKFSRNGRMSTALKFVLKWWLHILSLDLGEEHSWEAPTSPPLHLFVDARGSPFRCAAVLFTQNGCMYTDGKPSNAIVSNLQQRHDDQIMAMEALAIALGLSTFAPELHKRKVIVYSDNTAAEVILFSSKCFIETCCVQSLVVSRQPQEEVLRDHGITVR